MHFAKCLCIVIARMPASKYDYFLHKCLGIHYAATGFPGWSQPWLDFPNTEKLFHYFLLPLPHYRNFLYLKLKTIYLASLVLSYLISIICEFPLYLQFRVVERKMFTGICNQVWKWNQPFALFFGEAAVERLRSGTPESDCLDHYPIPAICWFYNYNLSSSPSSSKQWRR